MSALLSSLRAEKKAKEKKLNEFRKRRNDVRTVVSRIPSGIVGYDAAINSNVMVCENALDDAISGDITVIRDQDNILEAKESLKESDEDIQGALSEIRAEGNELDALISECEAQIRNLEERIQEEIRREAEEAARRAAEAARKAAQGVVELFKK